MQAQHELWRKSENFPVASWFLPRKHRRAILALYDFARGADELADNTIYCAQTKQTALNELNTVLRMGDVHSAPDWAKPFMRLALARKTHMQHGHDLIHAFKQDCEPYRCEEWDDLITYCRYSAVPVGRALLELCGEKEANIEAVDAMSTLLQLLDHLQDIRSDYETHGHIYLPRKMCALYKVEEHVLNVDNMSSELRALCNAILDKCDKLHNIASLLARSVKQRTLRIELTAVWYITQKLITELRIGDVMQKRVALTKYEYAWCIVKGFIKGW